MGKAKNGSRPAQAPATAATSSTGAVAKGNRPAKEFRIGRVRVSCWINTNSKGESWNSYTISRSYKDAQGNWKNSTSLGDDDLLVAALLLQQAKLWAAAERQAERQAQAPQADNGSASAIPEGSEDIPF